MSETTATIIVAVVTALGSVITALIGWLARKGVNFMDQKTKVLDEASDLQRKEAIKNKIVDTVTLVARATMQTYVDEVKAAKADGKLTKRRRRPRPYGGPWTSRSSCCGARASRSAATCSA